MPTPDHSESRRRGQQRVTWSDSRCASQTACSVPCWRFLTPPPEVPLMSWQRQKFSSFLEVLLFQANNHLDINQRGKIIMKNTDIKEGQMVKVQQFYYSCSSTYMEWKKKIKTNLRQATEWTTSFSWATWKPVSLLSSTKREMASLRERKTKVSELNTHSANTSSPIAACV